MRHQLLFYNETRFNHLLERLQIGLFNIQRPLQPRRWVEDCVLNHDSLYLHYDQLVTTGASTKISLYKVQRLFLVIVHHLQLHLLFFSHNLFLRTNIHTTLYQLSTTCMVHLTALQAIMATTATITLPEAVPQAHLVAPPDMPLEDIIMAPEGLAVPMDLLGTTALTIIITLTLTVFPQVVSELLLQDPLVLTVQANLAALVARLERITLPLLLTSMEVLVLHLLPLLMARLVLDIDPGMVLDTEDTVHLLGHHMVSDIMDLDMDLDMEDTVKVSGTTALLMAQ